jgi:ribosomal protein S18 acetylase RimI-like enzyme
VTRLRPATPGDADALADLWVALAREQRPHGSVVRASANRAVVREQLAARAAGEGVLVAEDEELLGFVEFALDRDGLDREGTRGTVYNLYVRPGARDRGLGSRLLAAAEEELTAAGADAVGLEVLAANDAARRFYRRAGYEPHRVAMTKPLAGEDPDGRDSGREDADDA